MTRKQLTILILLAGYVLIIVPLTVYHAFNFSDYIHWKGDEIIDYTLFLLLTSVLFQGLVWIVVKTFDWKAVILGTIVNYILSFIVGFFIMTLPIVGSNSSDLILLYGGCYLIFFITVTLLQSYRLRIKDEGRI